MTIYTIGHSTRTQQELLEILKNWGIACLVDIRSFPGSRKFPHFNREALTAALGQLGMKYVHSKALGGLRKKVAADSPNSAWENQSFRSYADYMLTPAFDKALGELIHTAGEGKTLIMCAEAVPWRCHRQLICDALVALKGVNVLHILSENKVQPHTMTRFAKLVDGRLIYPGKPGAQKPAEKAAAEKEATEVPSQEAAQVAPPESAAEAAPDSSAEPAEEIALAETPEPEPDPAATANSEPETPSDETKPSGE